MRQQQTVMVAAIILTALAAALGLVFSVVVSTGLTKPVRRLLEGAQAVERGELDGALAVTSQDEVGHLTIAFNRMIEQLRLKERIRETFGRYVDPRIVEGLISGPALAAEGQRRVMTVLFCDVKGFVGVSEEMTPQGLVKVMNRYFSVMSAPIHEHGGIIDKYIGDAIMAYWGPPFTADADQARLAALAALDMLARVAPFRAELPDLLGLRNVPIAFDIRIGIATGEALVGSIGSEVMMSYTVMGETVNLASRLEGANKLYGGHILASEAMVTAAGAGFEDARDRSRGAGRPKPRAAGLRDHGPQRRFDRKAEGAAKALRRGPCRLPQPPLGGSSAGLHRCARGDAGRRADPHHAQAHRWSCGGAAGGELGRRLASRSEINDARRAAWLQRSGGWSRRRTAGQSSVMSLASMAARRCSNFTSSSFGGARRIRPRRAGHAQAGLPEDRHAACSLRCRYRHAPA